MGKLTWGYDCHRINKFIYFFLLLFSLILALSQLNSKEGVCVFFTVHIGILVLAQSYVTSGYIYPNYGISCHTNKYIRHCATLHHSQMYQIQLSVCDYNLFSFSSIKLLTHWSYYFHIVVSTLPLHWNIAQVFFLIAVNFQSPFIQPTKVFFPFLLFMLLPLLLCLCFFYSFSICL